MGTMTHTLCHGGRQMRREGRARQPGSVEGLLPGRVDGGGALGALRRPETSLSEGSFALV